MVKVGPKVMPATSGGWLVAWPVGSRDIEGVSSVLTSLNGSPDWSAGTSDVKSSSASEMIRESKSIRSSDFRPLT